MRIALAALGLLAAASVHAEQAATVRVGSHPGFGRIVFDMPAPTSFSLSEKGSRVVVTFSGAGTIGMPDAVPRNVVSILGGEGSASLTLVPGARIRSAQMGNRIVIDVLDPVGRSRAPTPAPAAASAPPAVASPAAEPAAPAMPAASQAPEPAAASATHEPTDNSATPAAPPVTPAPVEEVKQVAPEAAPPAPPQAAVAAAPLRIPTAATVGAASFRRGDLGVVVFDDQVTVDASQFERAGLAGSSVREAGRATMLVTPLPPNAALELHREASGWVVMSGKAEVAAFQPSPVADGIAFPIAEPGRVVTVRDPFTGQTLLVGTSKAADGAGRANPTVRRAPGYVLLPTSLGLALEPSSDRVALRVSMSGFTLVTPDADSPAKTAAAAPESRYGLPNAPVPALLRQLHAQIGSAAAVPPRARGRDRVAAARTMLSLGMGSEAQALLTLAADEDPAVAADPSVSVLSGMAAVLAGRPAEAGGLDASAVDANDEVVLWRGLRDAAQGKPADALGRAVDVAMTYPPAVRRRILPPVVEAAVRDGRSPLTDERLTKSQVLGFARAMQAERDGKVDEALNGYDALDAGRNLSDSARAAAAALELRLAQGKIAPEKAADALERVTFRWRGDARELANRLRVAELRVQARQWRAALDSLRDTETLFPDAKPEIDNRKAGVFKALIAARKDKMNPLEIVTLTGDYADCIPGGGEGDAVASLLADELIALDLPSRAVPVLQRLAANAKSGRAKVEFALAQAQVHLDLGEPAKAEAAIKVADSAEIPPERTESRTLLLARARAGQGDARGATSLLAALSSQAANELRASLSAQSGDWQGSLQALTELAAKLVPAEGDLDDKQQDLVFREAVAAVQAGDADALGRLKAFEKRITGSRADQFRVLTASAVRGTGDLPRAASELASSRSFSARLDQQKRP